MKRALCLLFTSFSAAAALSACGGSSVLELDHHQTTCSGPFPRLCYKQADGSIVYESIQDFTYEWGHRYTLEVESLPVEPGIQDDPGSYRLISILSKEAVPDRTQFNLRINQEFVTATSTDSFTVSNVRAVRCASSTLCADLESRLESAADIQVTIEHTPAGLEAVSID
jgi:hypothetical protein